MFLGDSRLDFLYYFAKEANDTHPGLRKVEGSPIAGLCNALSSLMRWNLQSLNTHFFIGTAAFLVVAVTGLSSNEDASFSHVTLLGPNGESLLKVLLNSSSSHWSEEELVGHVDSVPRMPFSLHLTGWDVRGNLLERVSSETIHPTHVQIQVQVQNIHRMMWWKNGSITKKKSSPSGPFCSTPSAGSQLYCDVWDL